MSELTLAFAGCRIRANGLLPNQVTALRGRFDALAVREDGEADAEVDVHYTPNPEGFMRRPPGPSEYRVALAHEASHVALAGIGFTANVERQPIRAQLHTCLDDPWFTGAFENVLRVLSSYLLFDRGGLVLHSAALVDDDLGFMFCGRSGAGKSTLCRLASELDIEVLGDELNAVLPDGPGFSLQAVPFAGDFGHAPGRRPPDPLTAVLGLEHGADPSLRECSKAEAVSRIVASCPYVNTDPSLESRLHARARKLVDATSFRILTFAKRTNFWGVLSDEYGRVRS